MSRTPTRVVVTRSLLYGVALLLNITVSILLARRLSEADYAAYQFATKRVINYATVPISLFGLWMYRYLAVRRRGSFSAGLFLSLLSGILGILLGFSLEYLEAKVGLEVALLAGTALMLQSFMGGITTMLDATRPVRLALLTLVYRLLYSALIMVALYAAFPSLGHVFIATSLSLAISIALGLEWLHQVVGSDSSPWPTLAEWARTSRPLLIAYVVGFVASLDATIAYPLVGSAVVAAFFVAAAVATLVRESANTGLRYLHAYVLSTGNVAAALRSIFIVASLATPLFVYAAVHPLYIIYVFNYKYGWASWALTVFMITAIIEVLNGGLSNLVMGSIGEVGEGSVSKFERLNIVTSIPSLVYIIALAGAFIMLKGLQLQLIILAWSAVYMVRFALSVGIYYYWFLPGNAKGEFNRRLAKLALSALLAIALSLLFSPLVPPSRGLLRSIAILAEMGVPYLAVYYAIVAVVDPELRSVASRLLRAVSSGSLSL